MNCVVTWFPSQYIKNFCTAGKIGIGVILYEKGKGKFVGDWKTHRTEIVNKLKEDFVQLYAAKLINWTSLSKCLIESCSVTTSWASLICSLLALNITVPPPLFCCGYIITLKNQKVKYFCTTKTRLICAICTKERETHILTLVAKSTNQYVRFCAISTKSKAKNLIHWSQKELKSV